MTTSAQHTGLVACKLTDGHWHFRLARCSARVVHSHENQLASIHFRGLVDLDAIETLRQATAVAINQSANQVLYLDQCVTVLTQPPIFSDACMSHGQNPASIVVAESDLWNWANYVKWASEKRVKRAVFLRQQQQWAAEWALDHQRVH